MTTVRSKAAPRRRPASEWQGIVAEQRASGQTIREFASERGVNHNTLAWWRARLVGGRPPVPTPTFVEVKAAPSAAASGIEVVLPNGLVITAGDHVDPTRFARLIAALGRPC